MSFHLLSEISSVLKIFKRVNVELPMPCQSNINFKYKCLNIIKERGTPVEL